MVKTHPTVSKRLGSLVNANALGVIGSRVVDEIRAAHPGARFDEKAVRDALARFNVSYTPSRTEVVPRGDSYVLREPLQDLAVFLDTSGSMTEEGRYDCARQGIREAFAVGMGDGVRRQYGAVSFSQNTLFSGWVPKTHVAKLDQTLDKFQGGPTELEMRVLGSVVDQAQGPFGSIIVTDGIFSSEMPALRYLQKMHREGTSRIGVIYMNPSDGSRPQIQPEFDVYVAAPKEVPATMKAYAEFLLTGAPMPKAGSLQ